jgi:Putative Flp pilus-assembly TadE/G-like
MSLSRLKRETGSVMVMVAVMLPVIAIFGSFALDTAHYWDFSRNLQNRVDAAVLAAGGAYGGACFATPTQGQLDTIGKTAQKYSGVPTGTPDANLPYPYSTAAPYQNQINAPGADASKFHLVLNGSTSWDHGGASFTNGNYCAATYDGATGPAVDGWATQAQVPLFFKLFGFSPNISAHARVQLQGAGSTNSIPIAVPDPAQTPCLRAEVINDSTGALVTDVAMNPPNPTGTPPQNFWTVTLPAMNVPAAQLSVQAYIPDDCANPSYPSGGALYDPSHGVEFINTFQTYTVPIAAGGTPKVSTVWLTPGGCTDATEGAAQDAYFYYFPKSTTCTVTVHAQADFQTGASPNPRFWAEMDGGNPVLMTADTPATDGAGRHFWKASFQVPSESGRHTFQILSSTANGGNPARTAFNVGGSTDLQATYSAFSDASDPPDDSGPVTQAMIGDNTGATAGINSIQQGTSKTLTLAFRLQGLSLSGPNDPPIVLREAVQNRKATGAFDCGQGTGAQPLHDAIVNGCPDPVSIYSPAQGCVFLPTTPLTCANLVPGNRRNQVDQAFQDRVNAAVNPQNNNPQPCDMWQTFKTGTAISGVEPWNAAVPDSRIIIMVVTAPGDLSGGGGPTSSVKILGFAAFYITGFDGDKWLPNGNGNGGQKIPGCTAPTNQDEAYPGTGTDKFQIWGHFIKYVAAGTSNGQPCNVTDVSVCVPALTR